MDTFGTLTWKTFRFFRINLGRKSSILDTRLSSEWFSAESVLFSMAVLGTWKLAAQPAYTCSKLTIETLEQGVKYVQSLQ